MFITFLFCVNCSFCPPKCCLDYINPGEYVAGGTVAKFVTTITILLLLTVTLVSNILIVTNGINITNASQTNKDSASFLSKFT